MAFPGLFPITFFQPQQAAAASIIASIQPFSITLVSGVTSANAAIAAVDTNLAAIFPGNFTQDNATVNGADTFTLCTLGDATTVVATRAGSVGNIVLKGTVVEFNSAGVQSVQYGITTYVSAVASATATIASAASNRTAVFNLGVRADSGGSSIYRNYKSTATLSSPTAVKFERDNGTSSLLFGSVSWCAVNFVVNVATVGHASLTTTSAGGTETDPIAAVNPARSMLAWGGNRGLSNTEQHFYHTVELAASSSTLVSRSEITDTQSRTVAYDVIQFNAAYVSNVQRGTINIVNSALSNTATIASARTDKSVLSWVGFRSGGDQPNEQEASGSLTDATTVTAEKGTTVIVSGDDSTISYEVITFV
jgi:hypothetical protein